jgi:ubiquinone/menaquinone biosynthesis C-methylase UbiE
MMPSVGLIKTVLRETFTRERSPRVPEPDLVMDNLDNVDAYDDAGADNAPMTPVYLFHAANICEVIKPGDTVVDLACGPANQLCLVASMNPDINFIGVDLSEPMLDKARARVARMGLQNVTFRRGDITRLDMFADQSVDAVVSTMALHHLPTFDMLCQTYAEVARILKPGGGVYMVDFGHLKSERSIAYFGNQYAHRQHHLFTLDYINSLRAAFSPEEFEQAVAPLKGRAQLYKTWGLPFMLALKSPVRRHSAPAVASALEQRKRGLETTFKNDLGDLISHFGRKGMNCSLLGPAPGKH